MSKEIEELIEKAKSVYSGYGSSERYEKLLLYLDQALTKLRAEQPSAGEFTEFMEEVKDEIKKAPKMFYQLQKRDELIKKLRDHLNSAEARSIDCPNRPASKTEVEMAKRLCAYQDEVHELKQQPPAGDFTKECRLILRSCDGNVIWKKLKEACRLIDSAEAINKDLLTACEKIRRILQMKSEIHRPEPLVKPTWVCLKESDYRELEIIIIVALAKAKKEGGE